jgi:hypothetical protein
MNHKFLKRNYLNRRSALVAGCAAAFMIPLYGCEQDQTGTQRAEPAPQQQQQPDQRDQYQQQREPGSQYQQQRDFQQQDMDREREPGTTTTDPDNDRTGTGTATGDDRTSARPGGTTTDDS